MRIYKFVFRLFFLIMPALLSSSMLKATHFAGSDLSYTCLGGNTYLITYNFYRDCRGIPVSNTMTVNFKCSMNPSYNFSAVLTRTPGPGNIITPVCTSITNTCSSYPSPSNPLAFEEYVFTAQVTLIPCNHWTMTITSCCRNAAVNTVPGNVHNKYTSVAKLNNLVAPGNSSPVFTNTPVLIACAYQNFCFNHGAYDSDGDSLVFSFYPVYTDNASTSVSYATPYSYTNFLSTQPNTSITIDSATGQICFTANQIQLTLFGVKVEEYRTINGTPMLIGTVYRDLELFLINCNNNHIPVLSGMDFAKTHIYNPNDTVYDKELCLSQTPIEFHINAFDQDTFNPAFSGHPERIYLSWNNGIPGAVFTPHYNGTDSAYASFYWQPGPADLDAKKCFTVKVNDDACPYYGYQIYSYCLTVSGTKVNLGSDTLLCKGDTLGIVANADSNAVNFIWSLDGQPVNLPTNSKKYSLNTSTLNVGKHNVSIVTNSGNPVCPGRDTMIVEVVEMPDIHGKMPDTVFCAGSEVVYDAGKGTMFLWSDTSHNILSVAKTFAPVKSGVYLLSVDGGVNTRCIDNDSFRVIVIPNPYLGNDTCLTNDNAPLLLDAGNFPPEFVYSWQDGSHSRYFKAYKSGIYSVSLSVDSISSVTCSDKRKVSIINDDKMILSAKMMVNPVKEIEPFKSGDREICKVQSLKIKGADSDGGLTYDYSWYRGNKKLANSQTIVFKSDTVGDYAIVLYIDNGCKKRINVHVKDCDIFIPNVFTPKNIDGQNDNFEITIADDNGKSTGEPFYIYYPFSTLTIYNRWGKPVYTSGNYRNEWNGNNSDDGVYFWILNLNDGYGTTLHGTVTIISK